MITAVSQRLFRGPRPTNFDDLYVRSITRIINLEEGWFEFFHGEVGEEKANAAKYAMEYIHFPIGFIAPAQAYLDQILSQIQTSLENTYVHCRHGNDRTGIVCAYYRVKVDHWTIDAAIQEMYSLSYHKFPYEWPFGWTDALKRHLK